MVNKAEKDTGIVFVLNNERIEAKIENVSNANRNTVLTNRNESICLVEHFLAACSLHGLDNLEVITNKNELVFGDGSAVHWHEAFLENGLTPKVSPKYFLKETLFVKVEDKIIAAIPHDGFKASYFMDYNHPALGKLFASWGEEDEIYKLVQARTFATKEENDFFAVSDRLLTLGENGFNMKLHEPLEPAYHKILDIIGDLRLCAVNPLEINMYVMGIKSGHALNVEMARELQLSLRGAATLRSQ